MICSRRRKFSSAASVALATAYGYYLVRTAPSVSALRDIQHARPSTVMSADGQVLGSFRRAKVERVALAEVSPHVVNALIATEDHRFREHRGIDVKRTFSALFHTATGDLQGGSTITQQLARNLFPEDIGRSRSVHRKLKEMITALRIERVYTKDEILESYLNTVPFLYNVVGIEMAARTYCDTSARSLDIVQSATLVGMLKGTQYYNPVRNPERATARRARSLPRSRARRPRRMSRRGAGPRPSRRTGVATGSARPHTRLSGAAWPASVA